MQNLMTLFNRYFGGLSHPDIHIMDCIEIIVIAFFVYKLLVWIKNTKAWMLLRGLIAVAAFLVIASVFQMNAILWLAQKLVSIFAISVVIVFQPEIRRALEKLGEKNFLSSLIPIDSSRAELQRFTDQVVDEIVKASAEMAADKTGALIVVERKIRLSEYERTGIMMDSLVSRQLLLNIFEHNTPLHDGAIIVRGDRIVAATCYLPLSENRFLSKDLGTRHRAALGLSEVSDALIVIVSEESGKISLAEDGKLFRDISADALREKLREIQEQTAEKNSIRRKKGRDANERKADA